MPNAKNLILRGSNYSLKRRVPKRYKPVDARSEVWVSLHTDSLSVASDKAQNVWKAHIAGWEARLAGKGDDARLHFDAVRELAESKDIRYAPMSQVAELPIDELLKRIEAIGIEKGHPVHADAQAVLGVVEVPSLLVSEALAEYWDLTKDRVLKKSPDQLRRWKNPRIKAVQNFIQVVEDKPIADISRDDMLEFRKWWLARVTVEGRDPSTANKDFTHFGSVLKQVNDLKKLGLDLPVGGLHLKEGKKKSRPQFSLDWIKTKLLATGALDGLEDQARSILLAMINTGARPSELANLMPEHIILNHDFPHIVITADERQVERELKSKNSERKLPLLGVSLEAMKRFPDGFPFYHDNPTLSDVTNSYLTKHGLRETPKHTAYKGRPVTIDAGRIQELRLKGLGGTEIARELGIARSSVYRYLREAA